MLHHPAVDDLAVRRFDEPVVVDPGEAAQRADQADVGAFRCLNGAEAPIVARVHVADLEAGPLAGQAAGPQGRQPALVGDFRQRVRLVHELGKLGAAEEFLQRGHDRLGVDQVVGHDLGQLLENRHLLLDGALHAHEADAELVLEQLADGAHPAVAQVVDVVGRADAHGQLQLVVEDVDEILLGERALGQGDVPVQLQVGLEPAHLGQIVAFRIEEHALEHARGDLEGRGIAGAQLLVELDQRLLARLDGILVERGGDGRAGVVELGVADLELLDPGLEHPVDHRGGDVLVGLTQDFAGLHVDDVVEQDGALQVVGAEQQLLHADALEVLEVAEVEAVPALVQHVGGIVRVGDGLAQLAADKGLVEHPADLAALHSDGDGPVEEVQDLLVALVAQGPQEDRGQELALAVDADVQDVLVVVLELHPRAAVGNHLAEVVLALRVHLEEYAGRPVQLGDDDAFGAIDDERAPGRHQRHFAEEHLLLLHVADGPAAALLVDVVEHEPDGDLERHGIGHAAVDALVDGVLDFQLDRIAAGHAPGKLVLVAGAARRADDVAEVLRIGDDGLAAVHALGAQVLDPHQAPALALPVAQRVMDELETGGGAEILDGEDRSKHRLDPDIFPLVRQQFHLQEGQVGFHLDLEQVGDGDGCRDMSEIVPILLRGDRFGHGRKSPRVRMGPGSSQLRGVGICQSGDGRLADGPQPSAGMSQILP